MNHTLLKKVQESIERCRRCGSCQASCPVYFETLDEANSPRGKIVLAEAVISGKLKPTRALLYRISNCLSCYACSSSCVNSVKTVEILNFAKNHIFSSRRELSLPNSFSGFILKSPLLTSLALRAIRKLIPLYNLLSACNLSPFLKPRSKRRFPEQKGPFLQGKYANTHSRRASVLFFPGCLADLTEGENIAEILKFLKEQNVEVSVPRGLVCCGAPSYYQGDNKTTLSLIKKNTVALSQKKNIQCIVTACATCGHMLKNIYPEMLKGISTSPLPVMDIQEFLLSLPGFSGTLMEVKEPTPQKMRVTYHDPCHLTRGQGISKEPRELLKGVPEIEYIEMEEADRCCGGGGAFCFKHADLSASIAKHKVRAIKKTGAGIVATACPSCRLQLVEMTEKSGLDIEVIHTVQLVQRILNARKTHRRNPSQREEEQLPQN